MNKKIIFPFFLFLMLFVCVNNVNASQSLSVTEDSITESMISNFKKLEDEFLIKNIYEKYPYYSVILYRANDGDYTNASVIFGEKDTFTGLSFSHSSTDYLIGYSMMVDNTDNKLMKCDFRYYNTMEQNIDDCKSTINYGYSINSINNNSSGGLQYFSISAIPFIYKGNMNIIRTKFLDYEDYFLNYYGKNVEVGQSFPYATSSIALPELKAEEISHELNDDSTYKMKTIRFSFSSFDKEKYKYKYSLDSKKYHEFEKNELIIDFEVNGTMYFQLTDLKDVELREYNYVVNDIGERKFGDSSLDISDSEFPNFSEVDKDVTLEDESDIGSLIQWFYNNITNKFKIITQIKNIYDTWTNWNPRYDPSICYNVGPRLNANGHLIFGEDFCTPKLSFVLKLPGQTEKKEYAILDFRIVESIKSVAFEWIRVFMYIGTFLKCLKILQQNFSTGGGN